MKKLTALFLALVICLGLFAACGGGQTGPVPYEAGDGLKPYDPPVKITCGNPMSGEVITYLGNHGMSAADNEWITAYRERLGIKLVVDSSYVDLGGYTDKLFAAVTADTVPDLVLTGSGEWSYSIIKTMYKQDQLADMTDALEKLPTDDLRAFYDVAGEEVFYPARFGGRIYAVPQLSEANPYNYYFIRKDWLDNLNLSVPETFDELISVCEAFANQDPDGNGEDDTYGLSFGGEFFDTASIFFAAYNAYPGKWIKSEDGKSLIYGSFTDEAKNAVKKLAEMYQSGALNPAFTETGFDGLYTEVNIGHAGVYMGQVYYPFLIEQLKRRNPDAEIVAVRAMTVDGSAPRLMTDILAANYFVVHKRCPFPEALVKMMNLYVDIMYNSTSEEDYYKYVADENGLNIWSASPIYTGNPSGNVAKATAVVEALKVGSKDNLLVYQSVLYDQVTTYEQTGQWDLYGDWLLWKIGGTESDQKYYYDNDCLITNGYVGAKTDSMALYGDELFATEYGGFSGIILGLETVDAFDTLKDAWMTSGGADIVAEVNEWYQSVIG